MKKIFLLLTLLLWSFSYLFSQEKELTLNIFHTTDIHGNFFPFDFMNNRENRGGLARVSTFIAEKRATIGRDNFLLMEGGDLLQGQPCVYYYNFIDTTSIHLGASTLNYIGYDISVMGNHDIETGHSVYDRWVDNCTFPVLGANILKTDGEPYLPPYAMFQRGGMKVAVLGMITEAIPAWLPENLWTGLRFANIEETARKWIPIIKEKENPDVVIALIHSGVKSSSLTGFDENVGMKIAQNVPGLDAVFCGHDHSLFCEKVVNCVGDSVLVIDPANSGNHICDVTVRVKKAGEKVIEKTLKGDLVDISSLEPDAAYMEQFSKSFETIKNYVNAEIGEFTNAISARESFFGPSDFIDLLHTLQLKVADAEISLVAPLSQSTYIGAGKIYMRDMFNLYRYENLLYTMNLTGKEIKDALEYCYGIWTNQMTSPDDHLLLIQKNTRNDRYNFINPSFGFDSAAGLLYTVDVTKPVGEKVTVASMADGTPFLLDKTYRVAVNSYQGSGGAGILTEGAGISREELDRRIVKSTDKDLRYYLAEEIKKQQIVHPQPLNQWRFIPEEWVKQASERDYKLMFGNY
ncbi:bifunctional metallophosphatase/5'-nucleotidase [Bacteroides sp. 214]|uniref:bifunctional metallophosphatase/5'-nucleotidase n=1 Tax=Bacteroides sp. 214 TaxID=2302935 RepID=UPI0013D726DC|nr:bifunctional metallophosphatase/5'-nucleotidase [Bacteroides sp. 214]NDW11415.1 bifunctional metallophosphatase/5'-nucleotidase [Bacteroides sp. 214]